jgi:hypothetical protein
VAFKVGDYVWYARPNAEITHNLCKITQSCPTSADFEVMFMNGDTVWTKSWNFIHATNEESMLAMLEN